MNLVLIKAEKMEETYDVKNVAIFMLNKTTNMFLLPEIKKSEEEDGKGNIEKNVDPITQKNVENGTKEIWSVLGRCHWKLQKNILRQKKVKRKKIKEHVNGKIKILRKEELKKNYNIGLKQEKLKNQTNVQNVNLYVNYKHIMKTIQNLWKLFGYVQDAIFFYIMNTNITVRDLTRRLQKEMRKSDPWRKPKDSRRNDVGANVSRWLSSNSEWQAGGKAKFIYIPPGYNNDPCMLRHTTGCSFYQGQCIDPDNKVVHLKPTLIDLDTYVYDEIAA